MLIDYVKKQLGDKGQALGVGLSIPVPALVQLLKQYEQGVTTGSQITWAGTAYNTSDDLDELPFHPETARP
jgi:hypothetical protein